MRVYTLSDMRSEKKMRVYTASEAKGLTIMITIELNSIVLFSTVDVRSSVHFLLFI